MTSAELIATLRRVRNRQLSVFADLEGDELLGHKEHHLEPPIWEMGHVAWFQEYFLLRACAGQEAMQAAGDSMYDSFHVSYKIRWEHDFPSKAETLAYAEAVLEASASYIEGREPTAKEVELYSLAAAHEAMHTENLLAVRQNQGYAAPSAEGLDGEGARGVDPDPNYQRFDVKVAGGVFSLGAARAGGMAGGGSDGGFVLDNEKWAHDVEVQPFRIASTAVTNAEYAEFLDAGGYGTRSLWNKDDWNWRRREKIEHPLYWQKRAGQWHEKRFGQWQPIRPWHPVCHINLHEARAYCRFAGRRLPSEAEWEMAASWDPAAQRKRLYPWGDSPPSPETVHMSMSSGGTVDVRAKPAGDSALGCRQMMGNTWEWTASKFSAYPGFEQGAYQDYSVPYFDQKPVLRGGAWATDPWLVRNTWRNFFIKHRRNIFAGLRTCAL